MVVRIQAGFHSTRNLLWWVPVSLHGLILVIEGSETLQYLLCLIDLVALVETTWRKIDNKGRL